MVKRRKIDINVKQTLSNSSSLLYSQPLHLRRPRVRATFTSPSATTINAAPFPRASASALNASASAFTPGQASVQQRKSPNTSSTNPTCSRPNPAQTPSPFQVRPPSVSFATQVVGQKRKASQNKANRLRQVTVIPDELGKLIERDVALLKDCSFEDLVRSRRARGDLNDMNQLPHPAKRLLRQYKHRGAPVVLSTPPWSQERLEQALHRGPHKSCEEYSEFLREEFVSMINKGQWRGSCHMMR